MNSSPQHSDRPDAETTSGRKARTCPQAGRGKPAPKFAPSIVDKNTDFFRVLGANSVQERRVCSEESMFRNQFGMRASELGNFVFRQSQGCSLTGLNT